MCRALMQQAHVPEALQSGLRVTLAMGDAPEPEPNPAGDGEVVLSHMMPHGPEQHAVWRPL